MNIAIIIPSLKTGGAERAASELGKHLSEQGNKVFYFLFANSGRKSFDVKGEVVKTHIPYLLNQNSFKANMRELVFAARRLRSIKKSYEIDISISFMEWSNVVNICSKTHNEKVIVSVRTVLSKRKECERDFLFGRSLLNTLYGLSNKVVAVSEGVATDLIEFYGINRNKIVTIPNVSSRRNYIENETKLEWIYGKKAVVCVGRLDPVKQFDCVIRAFSTVYQRDSEARLIVVGDGKQMSHLLELRKRFGLEDVVSFVGYSKDIDFFLRHATCFVMASKVEGFPNSMVEAMAYNVPIISTDSPGGCGEILGRKHSISSIELCKYGIMTPHINREGIDDIQTINEEKILGSAIFELLNKPELHMKYVEMSAIRSKYYSEENVMLMWDNLINSSVKKIGYNNSRVKK